MRYRRALALGVAIIGCCLVAVGLLVSRQLSRLVADEDVIGQTQSIVGSLETLQALVRDAEVNHREYLITGEERDLQPFATVSRQLEDRLRDLQASLRKHPRQARRITQCRGLVLQYRDYLSRVAAARREHGFDAARRMLISTHEIATVQEMRAVISDMTDEARAIVSLQSGQRFIDAWAMQRTIFLSLIVTAAAGFGLLVQFRNEVRRRLTSEMRVREALSDVDDQVRQRTKELTEANDLKDRFLATVSHELRTPLNAIVGWVHIIKAGTLKERELTHAVDAIDRNAQAQVRSINNLLDVSSMMQGRLAIAHVPTDFGTVVDDVVADLQPAIAAKGLAFEYHRNAGAWVLGDDIRLRQVIAHLLGNALKFTPPNGRIEVHVTRADPYVELRVRDTGHGFAPEVVPRLFDSFYQASTATMRSGLGLGLTIVREIITLHGGLTTAESPGVGQGSCFVVRLPLTRGRLDASANDRAHSP